MSTAVHIWINRQPVVLGLGVSWEITVMNGRERLSTGTSHYEPDHVPSDISGSNVTGTHCDVYKRLVGYFGVGTTVSICEEI